MFARLFSARVVITRSVSSVTHSSIRKKPCTAIFTQLDFLDGNFHMPPIPLPLLSRSLQASPASSRIPISLPTSARLPTNITTPTAVNKTILDPLTRGMEYGKLEPLLPLVPISEPTKEEIVHKECKEKRKLTGNRIIVILRRKRRKHRFKKMYERIFKILKKSRENRRAKRELLFQAGLIAKVREADAFDAEKYVSDILLKIKMRPVPETPEQSYERYMDLRRLHRSNVNVIRPKIEDDY